MNQEILNSIIHEFRKEGWRVFMQGHVFTESIRIYGAF